LRVEKIAHEQLNMRTISPAITQYAAPETTSVESAAASAQKEQQ
jgi:cell division protein FtsL